MEDADYIEHDAVGLARLVRAGEVRPDELLETALERARRVNPVLNAVVRFMDDEARGVVEAGPPEGPFSGVPILIKDLLAHHAGVPTSSGSRLLREWVPDRDSETVRRLKGAGAVIAGKTNTPEFGLTPYTEPALWGPARNPWDPARTPGGSSGGSAAAVAAGVVALAHGNDGGGSIRIPASCCGLFGLKPTRGRIPTGPWYGQLWRGFAIDHVLTRSVRDSAAALDVLSGPDVGAPYVAPPPERPFREEVGADPGTLRIAVAREPLLGGSVHPECREATDEAAALLEELGHRVEEAAPPVAGARFTRAFLTVVCGECRADVREAEEAVGRRAGPRDLEPETRALALVGDTVPAAELESALRWLERASREVAGFFETYDVLLTPTLARPPVEVGALAPSPVETLALRVLGRLGSGRLLRWAGVVDSAAENILRFVPYTPVFNVTGQPAASVPLAWSADGLPLGSHLVGRFGDEATLLRLASRLEEARPWFHRLPGWVRAGGDGPPGAA